MRSRPVEGMLSGGKNRPMQSRLPRCSNKVRAGPRLRGRPFRSANHSASLARSFALRLYGAAALPPIAFNAIHQIMLKSRSNTEVTSSMAKKPTASGRVALRKAATMAHARVTRVITIGAATPENKLRSATSVMTTKVTAPMTASRPKE